MYEAFLKKSSHRSNFTNVLVKVTNNVKKQLLFEEFLLQIN